ncbi:MAG: excinuclease ABC subunit UvrB [Candidatus Buchananbacteria bacterium]
MDKFKLVANYQPRGDQPQAIKKLITGYQKYSQQTLLGVTGSGKTFTMAKVIEKIGQPTLILSHNKTLAAQLYNEFKSFFPENQVCFFISYYDYYQPESYLPQTDTFIEKDAMINEEIERLRLETAAALMSRKDVIVIASVSCIYGFGQPEDFKQESFALSLAKNNRTKITQREVISRLIDIQYQRNDLELRPGRFRVRGGVVDLIQGSANSNMVRLQFADEHLVAISDVHKLTGKKTNSLTEVRIFPAKPFVVPPDKIFNALKSIRAELAQRLPELGTLEAYRLSQRVKYDLEMIEQLGYCKGIENYSRHFDGRKPGTPPYTLLDFFNYAAGPTGWTLFIDESHASTPQVRGMYEGDHSRKKNLIDYGWRLPSAYDNRPLKFAEFEKYLKQVIYVSATPGDYELQNSQQVVEQIVRPTGIVEPPIIIRPTAGQVEDLAKEIKQTVAKGYRVLITTLTKKMAEELQSYLRQHGHRAEYLHSEIETLERSKIIKNLRLGKFDILVGINLLREGLDLPEVALVAILDADKEGFLRNARSLIQTIGRAARNIDSRVIMYADKKTESIKEAIWETDRRRERQLAYNSKHKITPQSIIKAIKAEEAAVLPEFKGKELELEKVLVDLEGQMLVAAENLDFEKAIELREKIAKFKEKFDH